LAGGTSSSEGVVGSTQVAAKALRGYGQFSARHTRARAIMAENDTKTTEDFGARETRVTNETGEGR